MPDYPWNIYKMSEGPLTVKEVHQGVNEQLNRKLGTDWGYSEYEWANLLQGFRPLPIRTASGTIAHFEDGADDVPMKSVVANITPIQEGTGDPSPSNPRPISGTSALNVTRTGANLWGYGNISGTKFVTTPCFFLAGTYTFSAVATSSDTDGSLCMVRWFYTDGTSTYTRISRGTRQSVQVVFSKQVANFTLYAGYNTSESEGDAFSFTDIQLELGTTATTYEPYKGTTYPIPLGRTVYGGTAEVVSGLLTITHRFQALDALEWNKNGSTITFYSETLTDLQGGTDDFYCSCYLPTENGGYNGQNGKMSIKASGGTSRIWVADNSYSTSADFKASLTGQTAVLKLSTPIEVQLTPEEVRTFLGANNVYLDSGEVLDVEYRSNF